MASFGIGAKLKQERVGQGLAIDEISRNTKIAPRFIEAIETDDFSGLPGLVFTRSFVRQYAITLNLDPEPFLAELPKQDESTVLLPNPPERTHSSWEADRKIRSLVSSLVWVVVVAVVVGAAYLRFHHSGHTAPPQADASASQSVIQTASSTNTTAVPSPETAPVQVSLTANEDAWVEVSADGKAAFTGTLKPNETREISATEQVRISTGNAGGLTVSLNGKTLESLGPHGQIRVVRLTAEGPQFLSKAPMPAADPL